jgi:TPR repeat protein
MCYYFGIGTTQNFSKAIKYFKALIKNEYWHSDYEFEEANYILGKLYLEGIHLKKSISKAIFHLNTANRENDHRSSQDILMLLKKN